MTIQTISSKAAHHDNPFFPLDKPVVFPETALPANTPAASGSDDSTVLHTAGSTLNMIWHKQGSIMTLTVPCASSWVDNENEIDRFLKEHLHLYATAMQVSYKEKKIVLRCPCIGGSLPEETLQQVEQLIERTSRHFDLLPVCMCCLRTASVEVENSFNGLRTICGLCKDELNLRRRHMELIEQQKAESLREMREEKKNSNSLATLAQIGVRGGLYACILGFIFFLLACILPMFHFMPCFPAAVAGVYVVSRLNKVEFYSKTLKFLIATFICLLTITVVSGLIMWGIHLILPTAFPTAYIVCKDPVSFHLCFGLPGYFIAAFFTAFVAE